MASRIAYRHDDILRVRCRWIAGRNASQDFHSRDGVVVSLMWPSVQTELVFRSCYTPTAARGKATLVRGRELLEVDHRPAAEVYLDWCHDSSYTTALREKLSASGGASIDVLAESSLAPLATARGHGEETWYKLAHPRRIGPNKELELFAQVKKHPIICGKRVDSVADLTRRGRHLHGCNPHRSITPCHRCVI